MTKRIIFFTKFRHTLTQKSCMIPITPTREKVVAGHKVEEIRNNLSKWWITQLIQFNLLYHFPSSLKRYRYIYHIGIPYIWRKCWSFFQMTNERRTPSKFLLVERKSISSMSRFQIFNFQLFLVFWIILNKVISDACLKKFMLYYFWESNFRSGTCFNLVTNNK